MVRRNVIVWNKGYIERLSKFMSRLLDKLSGPGDLKAYSYEELDRLAQEIREEILYTVALNGGHLAPNLGSVELTLALHRVYNSPKDKIIFDVGHQSYTHKLLTGRRDNFFTLRQLGGISGFPKPDESIHDVFATGHSSTSISVALGVATSRDLQKQDFGVVAVIGDGSITGGMALEAINHAGHLKKDLTVVLNDNEMSISSNVGALSSSLSSLRADPGYSRFKKEVQNTLVKVPFIGEKFARTVENMKDAFKYILVPGIFFEELGFTYLGPIDGHNIQKMSRILTEAQNIKGPVLVHAVTKKGKGYKPAEDFPSYFHGIGPFDIKTGKAKVNENKSFTDHFSEAIVRFAKENEKIIAITAAMKDGTGLEPFSKEYPERFFDVAIAEQHAVTFAAGLATSGMKPVVAIYSTFLQRAFDQIVHDVALNNLPVVFAVDRAGLVGADGPTHHGAFDLSYLRLIPNMVIFSPKDGTELSDMLYTALKLDGPVAIRYPKANTENVTNSNVNKYIEPGKAELLSVGKHVNVIAEGIMVSKAEQLKIELIKDGIDLGVTNIRTIKPLDEELVCRLATIGPIVVLENNSVKGGLGSAVLETLNKNNLSTKVKTIGLPDEFVTQGAVEELYKEIGLDQASLLSAIKQFLGLLCIVPEVSSK